MCITNKHYSYCMLMYLLFMFTSMFLWMVMLKGRKVDWIYSPMTEGCASEEPFFLSKNPYRKHNCCDAFLLMIVSLLILYERCLLKDDFNDYMWYISMHDNTNWRYNLWYDIAWDVLQAQHWLTFRPSAFFFMRTKHRLPENAQLGISSLVA